MLLSLLLLLGYLILTLANELSCRFQTFDCRRNLLLLSAQPQSVALRMLRQIRELLLFALDLVLHLLKTSAGVQELTL